jgi:cytoskeletal protein RodZ
MTVGHDNGGLGLASIRRNRGLSLEQIAQATKIEESDFKKLPGGIYNTSYIRQYARAIEFDEAELLAYYHSRTDIKPDNSIIGAEKKMNLRDFRFLMQH